MGSEDPVARDALALDLRQRLLQGVAIGWIELEQRLQDEAPMQELRVRDVVGRSPDRRTLDQQHVDVEWPRRVPRRAGVAAQLDLDPLRGREQLLGVELRLDREARVQEVGLPDGARLRLGLVDVRAGADRDPVTFERVAAGAQVREPVADVRAQAQPGPQSVRSFQTSTVTSSTGSGIGGSGFVARTVTASAL